MKNSEAAKNPHISAIPVNPKTRASHRRGVAPREKPGDVLFAMRRLSHAMNARSRTNAMRTTRTATMTFAALNVEGKQLRREADWPEKPRRFRSPS